MPRLLCGCSPVGSKNLWSEGCNRWAAGASSALTQTNTMRQAIAHKRRLIEPSTARYAGSNPIAPQRPCWTQAVVSPNRPRTSHVQTMHPTRLEAQAGAACWRGLRHHSTLRPHKVGPASPPGFFRWRCRRRSVRCCAAPRDRFRCAHPWPDRSRRCRFEPAAARSRNDWRRRRSSPSSPHRSS